MTTITVHPPPPALDNGTAKQSLVLRDNGDLGLTVALRTTGRRTTPLTQAIASNPIRTVTLATKFPPEFLQEMEDQTVMPRLEGELDSEPTGNRCCEAHGTREFPQPGGFQALLDYEFPEAMATDATSEQIRAFLAKGARQADAARQEFDQVVTDFRAEREDLHNDMQLLHADRVGPQSIDGIVEESIASQL